MADQSGVLKDVRRGVVPAHIYNDRELFELEKERTFGRSWMFVAHESEIAKPGGRGDRPPAALSSTDVAGYLQTLR